MHSMPPWAVWLTSYHALSASVTSWECSLSAEVLQQQQLSVLDLGSCLRPSTWPHAFLLLAPHCSVLWFPTQTSDLLVWVQRSAKWSSASSLCTARHTYLCTGMSAWPMNIHSTRITLNYSEMQTPFSSVTCNCNVNKYQYCCLYKLDDLHRSCYGMSRLHHAVS